MQSKDAEAKATKLFEITKGVKEKLALKIWLTVILSIIDIAKWLLRWSRSWTAS